MSCIVVVCNDPFELPKRVLNFGKFKGMTIKEVCAWNESHNKHGYLEWCLDNVKGFKEELTSEEWNICRFDDMWVPKIGGSSGEWQGPGAWLDPSDGALSCGFACQADMF